MGTSEAMEMLAPFEQALERMNLVVVGHVDHGKSTVVGRLLADTDSLPEGKIEQVRTRCERNGKQFEYAFLLDALADEQAQGITIDAARIFFKTDKRHYIIIDAPGHIEFLKNMITGASHAEAALLVIDAAEGVQENSRRHGYMLSLLGVKSIVVLINKMDLVNYSEEAYNRLVEEYTAFLAGIGVEPLSCIPISGLQGDNITSPSEYMPWYKGLSVLDTLDRLERNEEQADAAFRMYVQDVYKFTRFGDTRRIVAGTVDAGTVRVGDEVVFYPSGKRSKVRTIECFNAPKKERAGRGEAIGFTLQEQVYVARGELATVGDKKRPLVSTRLKVSLFWLGQEPMNKNQDYTLKVGTTRVTAQLESITKVIDAGDLNSTPDFRKVGRNNVAECVIKLNKAIAFDSVDSFSSTSRFVIIDQFRICGGGIIREALEDTQSKARERAIARNSRWIESSISAADRAERYSQRAVLLLVTGERHAERKTLGRALEARLFAEGKIAYFMGIGNIIYGLDSDLEGVEDPGGEHIRRLAEVANIMLNAGLIFIVSAADITQSDLLLIRELVGPDKVQCVWLGETVQTDVEPDLHLLDESDLATGMEKVKELLYDSHVIFRPW